VSTGEYVDEIIVRLEKAFFLVPSGVMSVKSTSTEEEKEKEIPDPNLGNSTANTN